MKQKEIAIAIPKVCTVKIPAEAKDKFVSFLNIKADANKPTMKELEAMVKVIFSGFEDALQAQMKTATDMVPKEIAVPDMEKFMQSLADTLTVKMVEVITRGNSQLVAAIPKQIDVPAPQVIEVEREEVAPVDSVSVGDIKRDYRGLITGMDLKINRQTH